VSNRSRGRPAVTVHRLARLVVVSVAVAAAVAAVAYARTQGGGQSMPVPVPIGVGPQFTLAAGDPARVPGLDCATGRQPTRSVHVELFAGGRALLLPAGIGVAPPRRMAAGTVVDGRCQYPLATLDPTGTVRISVTRTLYLGDLFRVWGQPLDAHHLCGFRSRTPVRAYVNGRRWQGAVGAIPLRRHAEIVVEIGPYVRPHARYVFPEGV
jgi:hypothetical protein